MGKINISDSVKYVGVDDKDIDLFESQYKVPNGVSYNSYVILDEKIAIMDTVDKRATDEWIKNLEEVLDGKEPDYLIVSHLEPDHAANIQVLFEKYPSVKLVGNEKTFNMLPYFFNMDLEGRTVTVKEGDELNLGEHTLVFVMAPMVHWPEVMVEYEKTEKILFSADGFGKFGALDCDEEWTDEARRYFINIVGKFGPAVQNLLKKAATLDIKTICPLHGPVLTENLGFYIDKYLKWSSYTPEEKGTVVAYASIHGNTKAAAIKMAKMLEAKGETVALYDLSRADVSQVISDSFKYDKLVVLAATYDGGIFSPMQDFLHRLKMKNFQKRKVAIIENGSWTPVAGRQMEALFKEMKDIEFVGDILTIKAVAKKEDLENIEKLVDELVK